MNEQERQALRETIEAAKNDLNTAGLAFLAELALDEVDRLLHIIERNKSGYVALQTLAGSQREEIEGLKKKLAGRSLVDEMKRTAEAARQVREDMFGEALYEALAAKKADKADN